MINPFSSRRGILLSGLIALHCFSGCSSTWTVTDSRQSDPATDKITLQIGETVEVLRYRQGIMWGGYLPGIVPHKAGVVQVTYTDDGSRYAVTLTGRSPGQTVVHYANRMSFRDGESIAESRDAEFWREQLGEAPGFTVEVLPAQDSGSP